MADKHVLLEGQEAPKETPRNSKGWDGKLRLESEQESAKEEVDSDEAQKEDGTGVARDQIPADEDLLDDYPIDTEEIDLVHMRISSMSVLRLERFTKVRRLCLRQNNIAEIDDLARLGATLEELDLYDNLISYIDNLGSLNGLKSLDLSFNKIKYIEGVNQLRALEDLYFVQNKINRIEKLEGLGQLRNLELAANRIREIENLDTLIGLEQLWLGKNKITEMKGLSALVNLRILSIQSNRISTIKGLDNLQSLEELYISHNALTEISGLDHNSHLHVLDVSNNRIDHLTGLSHLRELEEVWASNNNLSSFDEIERELADKDHLQTVYLEGNPLQRDNAVLYRNKVHLALPTIKQIDATYVKVS